MARVHCTRTTMDIESKEGVLLFIKNIKKWLFQNACLAIVDVKMLIAFTFFVC